MSSVVKVRFCRLTREANTIRFALLKTIGGEFVPPGAVRCDIADGGIRYHAKTGNRPLTEIPETDIQVSIREFAQELANLGATQVLVKPRLGAVRFFSGRMCEEHFARVGQLADQAYLARKRERPTIEQIEPPKVCMTFVPATARR
ncbi:hypothetical protein A3A68_01675 [Candidatus Saccharibacteria bacterium RIFCSPLOWO2_01_FULL_48_13]|nr:MAG: hypothetical protein A2884_01875 [Candidatus Saccharibacteria bacterium RIFCSPHIGHO2_01_FULL_48_12]OGL35917.1 MAG: hypothetical protein A3F38_00245 [Candidatus Saccharibacteria bacterium RIFCSPHIGHO2_12_FULL_48_21]OGL37456.1 MAG: hypothetical protein A3A68_01675 [Candidatus Saccharibacteria bacterium RIFCSPLOWO2_01_FULL_48_13]